MKDLRTKLGEELVQNDKDELHLMSVKHALNKLQQMIIQRTQGKSLVAALKKMRKEDNS